MYLKSNFFRRYCYTECDGSRWIVVLYGAAAVGAVLPEHSISSQYREVIFKRFIEHTMQCVSQKCFIQMQVLLIVHEMINQPVNYIKSSEPFFNQKYLVYKM